MFVTECAENEIKTCMQLKGGLFPLTTLQILNNDLQALEEQLNAKIEQAPNFFNNAPIVIDLYHLSKDDLLEDPLAEKIVAGLAPDGARISAEIKGGKIVFSLHRLEKVPALAV